MKKYSNKPPTTSMPRTPTAVRPQMQHKNCGWCGKSSHNRQACPAKDAICRNCGKRGHFAGVCRSTPAVTAEIQGDNAGAGDVEDVAFLSTVTDNEEQPWVAHINLCGRNTVFKIDTGADVTVIPESVYLGLQAPPPLGKSDKMLQGPSRIPLDIRGRVSSHLSVRREIHTAERVCH